METRSPVGLAKLTQTGPVHAVCSDGIALCGRHPLEGGGWYTGPWITRKLAREGCVSCAAITRGETPVQKNIA